MLARVITIRPLIERGITYQRRRARLNQGGGDRNGTDRGQRRVERAIGIERRRSIRLPFRQRTQGNTAVHETLLDIRAKFVTGIGRLTGIRIARVQRRGITSRPSRNRTNGGDRRQDRRGKDRGTIIGAGSRDLLFMVHDITRIHSTIRYLFQRA
jgi:hypothetical protein